MNLMEISSKIRDSLKNLLNILINYFSNFPHLSKLCWIIIQSIKKIKLQLETHLLELSIKPIYGNIELNKICYVDPNKIKFKLKNKKFFHWKRAYRIMGGDWDKNRRYFSNYFLVNSIKKKYLYGENWEDTKLYHLVPEEVKNKETWTYKNKRERDLAIAKIEKLYEMIKKFGYKKNTEIKSIERWDLGRKLPPVIDEVALAIGRNGDYFFINGKHRLSIAKVSNLKKIPVIFLIRHKKWMAFRKRFSTFISQNQDQLSRCANIKHPDLQDLNFVDCKDIFDILKEDILSTQNNIMLTLGAKLGYICSKCEEMGVKCYAVELEPKYYYFLKKIRVIENWNFEIFNDFNIERLKTIDFNIIYLQQEFLNKFDLIEKFIKLVNYSNVKLIYINKPKVQQYSNSKKKNNSLVKSIIATTHLKNKYKIFTDSNKREIIKLV